MFFASSALYPLWKMREGSLWLYYICLYNPFTWAVELIRFAFYLEVNWQALGIVVGCAALFLGLSFWAYDPARGIQQRKVAVAAGRQSVHRETRKARRVAGGRVWWRRRGREPPAARCQAIAPGDSAAACRQCRRPAPATPNPTARNRGRRRARYSAAPCATAT